MKKPLSIVLISLLLTSGALYVQQQQRTDDRILTARCHALQQDLRAAEEDIRFLNKHSQELDALATKGWLKPHSRLRAAEKIHHAAQSLSAIHFTFEPETILTDPPGTAFKVTKIILEIKSVLDTPVYGFLATLLKTFPGVLVLRKLSLSRQKGAPLIHGDIILEWMALAEEEEVKDGE